ncbi:bacterial SH3 domain protein [Pseudosulfitobacter pseudonitzschiae]|uniref:Bacterial SH3 domain protein n=2 Tax=Rhodobacterales TaxID=204455 RepID=A0A221K361_9RHOB|nr:bacterial SH3 domain protein [Pseudosulfitobacter pseudonitzschiae]
MLRFIVLTFGFLGWAFFEMSGGAGFDGEALRLSRIEIEDAAPAAPSAPKSLLAGIDSQNSDTADVTRVALNLTTTRDIIAPAKPLPTTTGPAKFDGATLSTASLDTDQENRIVIPSLIPTAQPAVQTADDVMTDENFNTLDVRAVSGNRVNVRGGPGTDFGVVSSLTRGEEVEILQDPGNGWVKLRPLNGGPEGWMADFLLTNS